MSYDFNKLLSGPPTPERFALIQSVNDERWSDFGRAVYQRMERERFARVAMSLLLAHKDSQQIIDGLIAYVNTGKLPWQK